LSWRHAGLLPLPADKRRRTGRDFRLTLGLARDDCKSSHQEALTLIAMMGSGEAVVSAAGDGHDWR
jgi:hypothetical protein